MWVPCCHGIPGLSLGRNSHILPLIGRGKSRLRCLESRLSVTWQTSEAKPPSCDVNIMYHTDSQCDRWEIIALMSHQASLRPRVKSKESANLWVFFPGVQAGAGVRFVTASFSRGLGPDLINLSHEPLLTEYFSVLAHNILNWRKNNGTSVIARKKIQTTY